MTLLHSLFISRWSHFGQAEEVYLCFIRGTVRPMNRSETIRICDRQDPNRRKEGRKEGGEGRGGEGRGGEGREGKGREGKGREWKGREGKEGRKQKSNDDRVT